MDKDVICMQWNVSHEKNEIMPISSNMMDLEIIILSEINQRKTSIKGYHLNVESKNGYK